MGRRQGRVQRAVAPKTNLSPSPSLNQVQSNEPSIQHEFVTAMIKGDSGDGSGHWAIKGGDAQAG